MMNLGIEHTYRRITTAFSFLLVMFTCLSLSFAGEIDKRRNEAFKQYYAGKYDRAAVMVQKLITDDTSARSWMDYFILADIYLREGMVDSARWVVNLGVDRTKTIEDIRMVRRNNQIWDNLLELEHVKALKESNGDVWHRTNLLTKIADRINAFCGGEGWLFSDALLGGKGIVSLFGIGVPKAVLALFDACMAHDLERAIPLYRRFTQLCAYITAENEVAALKATAEICGQKAGRPRMPYQPLEPGVRKVFEKYLAEFAQVA